jgi:hypothetical protein
MMLISFSGAPNLGIVAKRYFWFAVSKALMRSTNSTRVPSPCWCLV